MTINISTLWNCQFGRRFFVGVVTSFLWLTSQMRDANAAELMSRREAIVVVKGVAVPFSVFGIIKRLEQIPGIEHVSFNLSQGLADILVKPGAQVSDDEIRQAVVDASYTPGDIRWMTTENIAGKQQVFPVTVFEKASIESLALGAPYNSDPVMNGNKLNLFGYLPDASEIP